MMKTAKRISLALLSMTLAFTAGCALPFQRNTVCTPDRESMLRESISQSSPAPAQPAAAPSVMPTGLFGRPAPTQASLARKVLVAWNNQIVTTNDPVNGNRPMPGLAGRLYVFGDDEKYPLDAPGNVSIVVYAIDKDGKSSQPLANWDIDSHSLQRLARRDAIGHGYTIFLPWYEYRPEITRVRLDVRYVPDGGQPLFAPSETLSIHPDNTAPVITNQLIPAAAVPRR